MLSVMRFAQIFICSLWITACSNFATSPTANPTQATVPVATSTLTPVLFINHPKPKLSIVFDNFKDAGCLLNEYGDSFCNKNSPLFAFGCTEIQKPSNLLGGLNPAYPIATCIVRPHILNPDREWELYDKMIAEGKYLYVRGGLFSTVFIRYVIVRSNQFHLIKTEAELRKIYAPIETSEEALSYVLTAKDLSAYYDLKLNPDYEYQSKVVEDTYVKPVENGFHLHLYQHDTYGNGGCGPYWTWAVEVNITSEGIIQELSREKVFKNSAEDNVCYD